MAHARKQIRDAFKAGLQGLATTQDRVYVGRTRPLGKGHQPALLIYTRSETSSRDANGAPPVLRRPLQLFIEGRVTGPTEPDDALDQIAAEVEVAVATLCGFGSGSFLAGLVLNVQYVATEIVAEADGENQNGGIRLEYRVTYRTREGAPAAGI